MPSTRLFPALRLRAIACTLLAAGAPALAADALPDRQCSGGVCMANVDTRLSIAPCTNANLVVAWSQAGGAMAIQCMTDAAAMDQPIHVFDRRNPAALAYDLAGIRAFTSETLPQLAHVPGEGNDALLPACRRPAPPTMALGELLLTEKVASDNERHPYCYRVLRVASGPAGIAIRADDGKPPQAGKPDADWHDLAAKMGALVAQADAQSRARVARTRAPLRDAPDPKSAPRGFLVKGDAVVVLERGAAAGLVKVLYVGRDGRAAQRWIAGNDLGPDAR
jgi:hypothetical protein